MAEAVSIDERRDALVGRVFESLLGAMDLFSIYLGDRLGYYRALAAGGAVTSPDLATLTGTDERCTREWLEQQAVTGFLDVENAGDSPKDRRFRLPAGFAEPLTEPESLYAVAPFAQIFAGAIRPIDAIVDAFRTGQGVPYADYGADLRHGQAGTTRPMFMKLLAEDWMPALTDVHARLQGNPSARIADIGFGLGWSSIALAQAYPNARVDGFDNDGASVEDARANAEAAGVADRVSFLTQDAGDATGAGQYDFACAFECLHDMARPVESLSAMRNLVGPGGTVLIADEKVADRFTAPGDDVERSMYGWSIFHCLHVGLDEGPSAGTGTVIRSDTVREYADEAGFQSVEILPIESDFWRFYRLTA
jgi:2-polyprenyl-3-methyl-5-hydroxy-6-metoxy-1,4-benzoquinol methylase